MGESVTLTMCFMFKKTYTYDMVINHFDVASYLAAVKNGQLEEYLLGSDSSTFSDVHGNLWAGNGKSDVLFIQPITYMPAQYRLFAGENDMPYLDIPSIYNSVFMADLCFSYGVPGHYLFWNGSVPLRELLIDSPYRLVISFALPYLESVAISDSVSPDLIERQLSHLRSLVYGHYRRFNLTKSACFFDLPHLHQIFLPRGSLGNFNIHDLNFSIQLPIALKSITQWLILS